MDLSIILVNHNAKDLTLECINSIIEKTTISFEIILVDNASTDNTVLSIRSRYPKVNVISNRQNLGFAHANNQGIAIARGRYILLLNNDTILKNNALDKMTDYLANNSDVGAVTCKLFEADGKTLQRNCRTFPTPLGTMFGRASLLTKLFPNNRWSTGNLLSDWDYNSIREIDWASGAALMVRRSVIDQVGVLDDKNFFIYWEDTDWCKRIHDAGWKINFIPDAEIIHLTGRGGGRRNRSLSNRLIYQMHRSAFNYFRKHYLKTIFNPLTAVTYLGFIVLTGLKISWNSIKILVK